MITIRELSLLQTAGFHPAEWWLVYTKTDTPHWWNRFLDPRFQHVLAIRRDGRLWIEYRPCGEFTNINVLRSDATPWQLYQGAIIQRVVALRREGVLRSKFFVGPITCVEQMKALLGIRDFWLRTPLQLFNHCRSLYAQSETTPADARRNTAAQPPGRGVGASRRGGEQAAQGPHA